MTEQNPEVEDTEVDDENPEVEQPEEDEDQGRKGNPEAAKWRTRFREAEAERDTLRERLATVQRAEVIRQATGPGRLIDGEDVFRTIDLDELIDDEGNVDDDKISEAVETLVETKPHLGRPAFEDGVGVGERNPTTGATWADVIRG